MSELIEPQELKLVGRTPIINLVQDEITNLKGHFRNLLNELISERYNEAGIDRNDVDFVKNNVQIINKKGSKYDHHFLNYNSENERRIISIQREAILEQDDESIIIRCIYF